MFDTPIYYTGELGGNKIMKWWKYLLTFAPLCVGMPYLIYPYIAESAQGLEVEVGSIMTTVILGGLALGLATAAIGFAIGLWKWKRNAD